VKKENNMSYEMRTYSLSKAIEAAVNTGLSASEVLPLAEQFFRFLNNQCQVIDEPAGNSVVISSMDS
jgi:hypothetical protein